MPNNITYIEPNYVTFGQILLILGIFAHSLSIVDLIVLVCLHLMDDTFFFLYFCSRIGLNKSSS